MAKRSSTKEVIPLEDAEQMAFFEWVRLAFPKLIAYHVPNGFGKLGRIGRIKSKKKGVTPGIPDINIDLARGPYHGMRIEMKRQKGGVVGEKQESMIYRLREEGYFVRVCKGFEEARKELLYYLSLGEPQIG